MKMERKLTNFSRFTSINFNLTITEKSSTLKSNQNLMSNKKLFTADYEFHASVKMLYPYIQSAGGLGDWFADNVRISPEKVFTFEWDNERHKAIMASHRVNHYSKFEFLPEAEEDKNDPSYFELRLESNELTQSTFLKVSDYSDFDDLEELQDLWDGLVENLKKVVGG
jgi:hypothetical protein